MAFESPSEGGSLTSRLRASRSYPAIVAATLFALLGYSGTVVYLSMRSVSDDEIMRVRRSCCIFAGDGTGLIASLIDVTSSLKPAQLRIDLPRSIRVHDHKTVKLVLGEDVTTAIADDLSQRGILTQNLMIGDAMSADLYGADFSIALRGQNPRDVRGPEIAEWVWDVEAKKRGSHQLVVVLTIDTISNGVLTHRVVPTRDVDLGVGMNFLSAAKAGLKFLWTLVPSGAIAGLLTAFWSQRKKRQGLAER